MHLLSLLYRYYRGNISKKQTGLGKKNKKKIKIKILRNGFSMLGKKNDGFWFSDVLYKDGFSIFIESEI